jgi:hypothetical protein
MFDKIPDISKAHRIVGSMPIAILANSIFFFFKKGGHNNGQNND